MLDLPQRGEQVPVVLVGTDLDGEGPLTGSARPEAQVEQLGRGVEPADPSESGRGEHDGVEVVLDTGEPGVDVAADVHDVEVGPVRLELCHAAG